jgi:hypothetical protein
MIDDIADQIIVSIVGFFCGFVMFLVFAELIGLI